MVKGEYWVVCSLLELRIEDQEVMRVEKLVCNVQAVDSEL